MSIIEEDETFKLVPLSGEKIVISVQKSISYKAMQETSSLEPYMLDGALYNFRTLAHVDSISLDIRSYLGDLL